MIIVDDCREFLFSSIKKPIKSTVFSLTHTHPLIWWHYFSSVLLCSVCTCGVILGNRHLVFSRHAQGLCAFSIRPRTAYFSSFVTVFQKMNGSLSSIDSSFGGNCWGIQDVWPKNVFPPPWPLPVSRRELRSKGKSTVNPPGVRRKIINSNHGQIN